MKRILTANLGVAGLLSAGFVSAVSCGDIVTTPEVLDQDIASCNVSPAVTIIGPAGSLDLNDHVVTCNGTDVGILLDGQAASLQGGVSQNGTVGNCATGISVEGKGFHSIQGVVLMNNGLTGIEIISDQNSVSLSSSENNGDTGITISGARNSLLLVAAENNVTGILVDGDYTSITQSSASFNSGVGIDVLNANYSSFIQNTMDGNLDFGLLMGGNGQVGNLVTGNTAMGNGEDLFDGNNPACVGTTWVANLFDTANNACIE
ncbi:hypothetical protein MO867_12020 [Microbulbifer sp. OS29]|uniref:Periplasmic copper-binding protein NosD beta helix domain-containing protein n=1 Tax=Microbulbifer okhotskensis TaxID=2926617 RepID=A0A9X2ESQ2_9GAMM|nr:NosD domain-containing protein [Microbulbifer okhotskensis]MCO1335061.1 hypothetical protein [Microbulbifer okhotskensis]